MSLILGCPVVNKRELTHQLLDSLIGTVNDSTNFEFVIIDNSKTQQYFVDDYDQCPFGVSVIRNNSNESYYYPLLELYDIFPDDLIGLIHNDIIIYDSGWDQRILQAFAQDPKLGLIGFCGSEEIDPAGGFGQGFICNYRGELGQIQPPGKKINDLHSAAILDSLFMMFRKEVIPSLRIDDDITPGHFNDRIWSLRVWENNWRVAVLGVEIDHLGGQTSVGEEEYFELCSEWCKEHQLDPNINVSQNGEIEYGFNPGLSVYLEGEKRLLEEYRDNKGMIPFRIDKDYNLIK